MPERYSTLFHPLFSAFNNAVLPLSSKCMKFGNDALYEKYGGRINNRQWQSIFMVFLLFFYSIQVYWKQLIFRKKICIKMLSIPIVYFIISRLKSRFCYTENITSSRSIVTSLVKAIRVKISLDIIGTSFSFCLAVGNFSAKNRRR